MHLYVSLPLSLLGTSCAFLARAPPFTYGTHGHVTFFFSGDLSPVFVVLVAPMCSDVVLARVLDKLPAPLTRALRDAELDEATILRDYSRAKPDDLRDWLTECIEKRTRSKGESVMETKTKQFDVGPERTVSICDGTRGALVASDAIDQHRVMGGDPKTDQPVVSVGNSFPQGEAGIPKCLVLCGACLLFRSR